MKDLIKQTLREDMKVGEDGFEVDNTRFELLLTTLGAAQKIADIINHMYPEFDEMGYVRLYINKAISRVEMEQNGIGDEWEENEM